MEPDILTNEMVRASLGPLTTVTEQTLDFMTRFGVPYPWVFATIVVLVMGKSFGRVLERAAEHFFNKREGKD